MDTDILPSLPPSFLSLFMQKQDTYTYKHWGGWKGK